MTTTTLQVRETTAQSNYQNVRTFTMPSDITGEGFHALRLAGPYGASTVRKSTEVLGYLLSNGAADIGWVTYEILSRDVVEGDVVGADVLETDVVGGYYLDGSLLCRYCTVNHTLVRPLLSPCTVESYVHSDGIDSEAALNRAAIACHIDRDTAATYSSDRFPVRAYAADIAGLSCGHCGQVFEAPTADDESDPETDNTAAEMAAATAQGLVPIMDALDTLGQPFTLEDTGGHVMAVCVYSGNSHVFVLSNDGVRSGALLTVGDWVNGDGDGEAVASADFDSTGELIDWMHAIEDEEV